MAWSLEPLLRTTVPTEATVSIFEDIVFYRTSFLIFIVISIIYPTVHKLLQCINSYNDLESLAKQIVVLQHTVEAIVLVIATPIFTYLMVKVNFTQDPNGESMMSLSDIKTDISSIFLCCICFMTMYLYELSSRIDSPRPAFFIHHLLAVLDGFLAIIFPTAVMVKTCSALVYFICFEAGTFIGLFMYRIFPLNKYTPHVIMSGIVIFAFTRPIQVIWVGAAAFGAWGNPNHVKWQAVFQFVLACLVTILQISSLQINVGVWRRCRNKIKENGTHPKCPSEHPRLAENIEDQQYRRSTSLIQEDGEHKSTEESETPIGTLAGDSTPSPSAKGKKVPCSVKSPWVCFVALGAMGLLTTMFTMIMIPVENNASDSFVSFATGELEGINGKICQIHEYSALCSDINSHRLALKKYEMLPRHYRVNSLLMASAYPMNAYSFSAESMDPLLATYFVRIFRLHRTLGLGNSLRVQGYDEDVVNRAYWHHYNLFSLQDKHVQPVGNGIGSLCEYVAREYESLKKYAKENFDETFSLSETFVTKGPVTNSSMYDWCMSDSLWVSYLVRSDWEHHRQEAVSSLINTEHTKNILTHTIWHWESLFSWQVTPNLTVPMLLKSFDALVPSSQVTG